MAFEPVIAVHKLSHYFGEGALRKQILHEISADFYPGEIVILTGPSGSGKTTALGLVGTLRTVQEGSVKVLGLELNGAPKSALVAVRNKIGFIFQAHNLIDALTARQNVQMSIALHGPVGQQEADAKAAEILTAVGLEHRIDYYPDQLSGGQKQRVAIARALVGQPQIILADEPTAALDKKSGREVVEILRTLAKQQKTAILLVTHDNRILDIADRILALEDGRISSFASGLTANAGQMLQSLAGLTRRGMLLPHFQGLSGDKFVHLLEDTTHELEQLLHTLEAARQQVTDTMLAQVLVASTIKIVQLLEADRGTIFLVDKAKHQLRSQVALHPGEEPLEIVISLDQGVAGHVARTGESLNVPDVRADPRFDSSVDRSTGYQTRNVLCIPICTRSGEVFAVGQLLNKKNAPAFTSEDEKAFREFARPMGLILESCVHLRDHPLDDAPPVAAEPLPNSTAAPDRAS
jgi:putative ABC transport system ATP-binding protein